MKVPFATVSPAGSGSPTCERGGAQALEACDQVNAGAPGVQNPRLDAWLARARVAWFLRSMEQPAALDHWPLGGAAAQPSGTLRMNPAVRGLVRAGSAPTSSGPSGPSRPAGSIVSIPAGTSPLNAQLLAAKQLGAARVEDLYAIMRSLPNGAFQEAFFEQAQLHNRAFFGYVAEQKFGGNQEELKRWIGHNFYNGGAAAGFDITRGTFRNPPYSVPGYASAG